MSTFCAIVTALALPVGGCAEEAPIRVPDGDRAAFSYEKPEPPAPPPAPEPAPVQEPRTIIQIVPAPAPSLPPEPVPEPVPAPEPEIVMVELPAPDPAALRLAATRQSITSAYAARRGQRLAGITPDPAVMIGNAGLMDINITGASFGPEPAAEGRVDDLPGFSPPDELSLPSDLAGLAERDEAARYADPGVTGSLPVDNARILAADRYITGVLESSINTQVSGDGQGSVIIQTSRDIFGYHGRYILLPREAG